MLYGVLVEYAYECPYRRWSRAQAVTTTVQATPPTVDVLLANYGYRHDSASTETAAHDSKALHSKLPQWEYGHGVESLAVIDRGTESKAPGSQNLKSNTVWTLVQRVYTSRGHMEVGSLRVWLSGR